MNLKRLSMITIAVIPLNACATLEKSPHPHNWARALQNQETPENLEVSAKFYPEIGQPILADAEQTRQMANNRRPLATEIE